METFAERRDRVMPPDICPAIKLLFEQRYNNSRRYQVITSDTSIYQIINTQGKSLIVDLEAKTCTCNRFQEYQGPCSHAIKAARVARVDPYSLFSYKYLLHSYRLCYQLVMQPLLSEGLELDDIQPPLVVRRRERPQKERIRKRVLTQSKKNKCSNPWCR